MKDRMPWLKWYPSDWRAETRLRMCSRAARSFWLDLIGLMHEAEPYGFLHINGAPTTPRQLANVTGDREAEVKRWLAELEAAGVFSRDKRGTIYCRRMVRDKAKRDLDSANGRHGGNPKLRKGVNPPHIPEDKAQRPEARDQNPETREESKKERVSSGEIESSGESLRARSEKQKSRKASRLPENWVLPDEWRREAEQVRTKADVDYLEQEFRNYWIGVPESKGMKLNWHATWRNWVLRDGRFQGGKHGGRIEQSLKALADASVRHDGQPRQTQAALPHSDDDGFAGSAFLGGLPD